MKISGFCPLNYIKHIRTQTFKPESNGKVERFVNTFKKGIQKSKGKGTVTEILGTFLTGYRCKPNTNTPNGNLLADEPQNLVMCPSTQNSHKRNPTMEQFNHDHIALNCTFKPGQQT